MPAGRTPGKGTRCSSCWGHGAAPFGRKCHVPRCCPLPPPPPLPPRPPPHQMACPPTRPPHPLAHQSRTASLGPPSGHAGCARRGSCCRAASQHPGHACVPACPEAGGEPGAAARQRCSGKGRLARCTEKGVQEEMQTRICQVPPADLHTAPPLQRGPHGAARARRPVRVRRFGAAADTGGRAIGPLRTCLAPEKQRQPRAATPAAVATLLRQLQAATGSAPPTRISRSDPSSSLCTLWCRVLTPIVCC